MDVLMNSRELIIDGQKFPRKRKSIKLIELLLLAPGVVGFEEIVSWIYIIDDDIPLDSKKLIHIFVMRARRILEPFNMEIRGVWGRGYTIENKPIIRVTK